MHQTSHSYLFHSKSSDDVPRYMHLPVHRDRCLESMIQKIEECQLHLRSSANFGQKQKKKKHVAGKQLQNI